MSKKCLPVLLLLIMAFLMFSPDVFAGPGEGGKLPYETWVRQK